MVAYLPIIPLNGGLNIFLHERTGRCNIKVNVINTICLVIVIGQHRDAKHFLLKSIFETTFILSATPHQQIKYGIGSHHFVRYVTIQ